ncbi:MAG: DUF2723 domain-containing protein [Vicinamibacterales bacterium]
MASDVGTPRAPSRPGRLAYAAAVCLPPLLVYARTMTPGLVALGDVPKLQFLGVVLGTSHSPGYPLFTMLSWAAAQVPFGSVAWRINAMTMIFGVAAAGATAWAARRCGASRAAALVAAWGLASGPVFWDQAIAAEVYTLAALLQAAAIALVIRWAHTRRDAHLLQAVAVSALALGHHPTFAMTAPAFAVFVLLTDWRVITRVRIVAGSAALLLVGLAQYGYLLWRTSTGSYYLEARASDLAELWSVVRGAQFEDSLFAFTPAQLLTERLPLVWHFVRIELGLPGVILAAAGAVVLARREWRTAVLLGLSAAIITAFAASYDVPDVHVFVIPVFVCAWIAAGVGLTALVAVLPAPRLRGATAALVSAALLVLAVRGSWASHDHHDDTWDAAYIDALVRQVSSPATIAFHYNDAVSHAIRYALFVDRLGDTHRLRLANSNELVDPAAELDGRAVYSFDEARPVLESRGFLMAPVVLDARLGDRLATLDRGDTVVVRLPANAASWLEADDVRFLQAVGLPRLPDAAGVTALLRDGAVVRSESGPDVRLTTDLPGGRALAVVTAGGDTTMTVDGAAMAEPASGLVAAIDPAGDLLWVDELDRRAFHRPVFDMPRRPLYRAVGLEPCAESSDGAFVRFEAADVPALATRLSAWIVTPRPRLGVAASATLAVYAAADEAPLDLSGRAIEGARLEPVPQVFDRATGPGRIALAEAIAGDGLTVPDDGRFVSRWEATISGREDHWTGVAAIFLLSSRPAWIAARGAGAERPVRFCLPPVQGLVPFGDASASQVELVRGQSDAIGPGWHGPEGSGAARLRWTSAADAEVRVSLAAPLDLTLELGAGPQVARPGETIDLLVNGRRLGARPLLEGQQRYGWDVPAEALRAGYNTFVLSGPPAESPRSLGHGGDERLLSLGVRSLVLRRRAR